MNSKNQLILPPLHHSLADWDMIDQWWTITTHQFVSPPSCMWYHRPSIFYYYQLCKAPGTLCMPQGRIITYVRNHVLGGYIYFLFRNTAPVGQYNTDNGYHIRFGHDHALWRLHENLNGVGQRSWNTDHAIFPLDTWIRYRVSWWITWDILQVRLEHEVDGEWVQDGTDISVASPLFSDSDILRCGIGATAGGSVELFFDDTEIWEYP